MDECPGGPGGLAGWLGPSAEPSLSSLPCLPALHLSHCLMDHQPIFFNVTWRAERDIDDVRLYLLPLSIVLEGSSLKLPVAL